MIALIMEIEPTSWPDVAVLAIFFAFLGSLAWMWSK